MRLTYTAIFLFYLPFLVKAQSEAVYDGKYEFKGRSGHATFQYVEGEGGEMILNGFFTFDRKEIDSLDQTLLTKFQVRGSYVDNRKHGPWNYDQERHKITLEDVVNFKVESTLESEDLEIKATYQNGLPHGQWQLQKNVFLDGEVDLRARAEEIRFEQGVMKGNVSYRNFLNGYTQFVRGGLNDRGFMDGEWSLVFVQDSALVSEVRNYENGFLLGMVRRNLDTGDRIDEAIFYSTINKLEKINQGLNEGFRIADATFGPEYNDGFSPQASERRIQDAGNEFLGEFILDLMRYDDAVTNEEEFVNYPFFTRRFEYDLTEGEEALLAEIPTRFEQLRDSVLRFSEMNSLSLNRLKSDSLAFSHAYFQNRRDYMEQLSGFVELLRTGDIRYYDLDNYVETGGSSLFASKEIVYVYSDDTLSKEMGFEYKHTESSNFLADLGKRLSDELDAMEQISAFVSKELFDIEVNSRLIALEARIINRRQELDTLFMGYNPATSQEQLMIEAFEQQYLGKVFESLSSEYANRVEFESKIDMGNIILDLFEELEIRLPTLPILFERHRTLDEIYMEETFNPFTYSRYNVRAKERLFDAYTHLFSAYISDLVSDDDYTRIKEHITKIEKLQDRMYELRDQDTRAIERRLGRRQSVSRIESALDL